jgi:hypothetical protein
MHRYVERVAIASAILLQIAITLRTSAALWHLYTILAIVVGLVIADLLSGVVHWMGDAVAADTWPWIGKHFVVPFRAHHIDPMDITRHDFVETNGNNAIMVLAPSLITLLLSGYYPHIAIAGLTMLIAILWTNQIHKWAHLKAPPKSVAFFQRFKLILPPAAHAEHHQKPFNRSYCITTGWCNTLTDRFL